MKHRFTLIDHKVYFDFFHFAGCLYKTSWKVHEGIEGLNRESAERPEDEI